MPNNTNDNISPVEIRWNEIRQRLQNLAAKCIADAARHGVEIKGEKAND